MPNSAFHTPSYFCHIPIDARQERTNRYTRVALPAYTIPTGSPTTAEALEVQVRLFSIGICVCHGFIVRIITRFSIMDHSVYNLLPQRPPVHTRLQWLQIQGRADPNAIVQVLLQAVADGLEVGDVAL